VTVCQSGLPLVAGHFGNHTVVVRHLHGPFDGLDRHVESGRHSVPDRPLADADTHL